MTQQPRDTEESEHTLIFIHGMCHGPWCWEEGFAKYFADRGFRCLLPALDRTHPASIRGYVDQIHQLLETINGPFTLIGHSMGGYIILRYLERFPCVRAVLLASVPPQGILTPALGFLTRYPTEISSLLSRDILRAFYRHAHELYGPQVSINTVDRYKEQMVREPFSVFLEMLLKTTKRRHHADAKWLIIGGEEDRIISQSSVHKTGKWLDVRPLLLPGLGHNIMLETGSEVVAEHILRWLPKAR